MIVGNFLSSSGRSRGMCEELAIQLRHMGWSVLTTSDKPGRFSRLLDMLSTIFRQRRNYALAQVDVHSGPAFFLNETACWALRTVRKPYVITLHGGDLPVFADRWPVRVRRLLRSAVVVTTPSQYLLEAMKPYRADLKLMPNALDVTAYEFHLRDKPRPRLVWLRAFHDIYNPCLAPKVVATLVDQFPDIQLSMIGPDKGDGSLQATKQIAEKLGVSQRIRFPGAVPKAEVPDWINRSDIFLNTTDIDNTPVSVLEAMACGLCVVSTNVGGIPYLIRDEENGLLVPPNDAETMAAAVGRLLRHSTLARKLSLNARAGAERLDWSAILPQWDRLLCSVDLNETRRKGG